VNVHKAGDCVAPAESQRGLDILGARRGGACCFWLRCARRISRRSQRPRQSRRLDGGGAAQSRAALRAMGVRPAPVRFLGPTSIPCPARSRPSCAKRAVHDPPRSELRWRSWNQRAQVFAARSSHPPRPSPCFPGAIPDLSNPGSLPGEAGGFPIGVRNLRRSQRLEGGGAAQSRAALRAIVVRPIRIRRRGSWSIPCPARSRQSRAKRAVHRHANDTGTPGTNWGNHLPQHLRFTRDHQWLFPYQSRNCQTLGVSPTKPGGFPFY
jgi:hypothetical protein